MLVTFNFSYLENIFAVFYFFLNSCASLKGKPLSVSPPELGQKRYSNCGQDMYLMRSVFQRPNPGIYRIILL